MPWRVAKSSECPESRPWAVIKDDDGSVEGCHASEDDANGQMAALYASEQDDRAVNLKPTAAMASAAKKGLRLHEEGRSGKGLKPETVRRAKMLARREEMNRDWVVEMNAWFARHESDRKPGWDKPGSETPGYTAFLLWGGAPAKSFAARKVRELESQGNRSMQMDIERRDIEFQDASDIVIEQRSDGRPVIRGLGVVYNRLSVNLGGFKERIMPGAFDAAIRSKENRPDLVSYFNHDANIMLGRESSGTLKVWTDERGVWFEVMPPATRADIVELIQRGDVRGASMTFSLAGPNSESFVDDGEGNTIREIRSANIYELGPVVQPAYPSTTAAIAKRNFERWRMQQDEVVHADEKAFEKHLNNAARLRAARLRSF